MQEPYCGYRHKICILRLVQKCTIREMSHNLLKLSKPACRQAGRPPPSLKLRTGRHALKFGLTAGTGCNRWQTLTLGTKLATRANKWWIRVTSSFAEASDGQSKTAFLAVLV